MMACGLLPDPPTLMERLMAAGVVRMVRGSKHGANTQPHATEKRARRQMAKRSRRRNRGR